MTNLIVHNYVKYTHTHTHTYTCTHSSCSSWGTRDAWSSVPQLMDLLVVDLCSSLANFMMAHPRPVAGKWSYKLGKAL